MDGQMKLYKKLNHSVLRVNECWRQNLLHFISSLTIAYTNTMFWSNLSLAPPPALSRNPVTPSTNFNPPPSPPPLFAMLLTHWVHYCNGSQLRLQFVILVASLFDPHISHNHQGVLCPWGFNALPWCCFIFSRKRMPWLSQGGKGYWNKQPQQNKQ